MNGFMLGDPYRVLRPESSRQKSFSTGSPVFIKISPNIFYQLVVNNWLENHNQLQVFMIN